MRTTASTLLCVIFGILLSWPAVALSAAFTDPVRIESASDAEKGSVTFVISPPLWGMEASWPNCWTLRVKVPLEPEFKYAKPEEHYAALKRLRDAVRTKEKVHFGPAGKGLIPSKDDRCLLHSKALSTVVRNDGIDAVISFHD